MEKRYIITVEEDPQNGCQGCPFVSWERLYELCPENGKFGCKIIAVQPLNKRDSTDACDHVWEAIIEPRMVSIPKQCIKCGERR